MKIYELQNIGKGVITSLEVSNLLLLYDDSNTDTLDKVIESNGAKLEHSHSITVQEGLRWETPLETLVAGVITQEMNPIQYEQYPNVPLYRIGTGVGNQIREQSLSFYSDKTVFRDLKYNKGLEYDGDYESHFTDRSLVTKKYIKSRTVYIEGKDVGVNSPTLNQLTDYSNDFSKNYIDVFPPSGYTMDNFVACLPSLSYIAFAGDVSSNDILWCRYRKDPTKVRIIGGSLEQRSAPLLNYLIIFSL